MPVLIYFLQGKSAIGDHGLVTFIRRILEKLKNNPVFPKPSVALAEPEKVLPEEAALVKSKNPDKVWGAIKNGMTIIVVV